MPHADPRVDAYIAKSAGFAKPILTHFRALVHAACPDVEETIKWGFPHFQYKGMLCAMAAFKAHCVVGFWKNSLVIPADKRPPESNAMGSFGRLTKLSDLPGDRALTGCVKKAMKLNDDGVPSPHVGKRKSRPAPSPPPYLAAALRKNAKSRATWQALSSSKKREYIEWVTEAKTEATRARRLATTVEWLAEGKSRNWRYQKKR
jgi:hypothetical protein